MILNCYKNELKVEFWDVHFCQRSFNQLMRNETNKKKKYKDARETFIARNDEDTAQSRRDLRFTNAISGGAPKISITLRKKNFRTHQLLTTLLVHTAIELLVIMVLQTGGCEFANEMYSTVWRSLLCQE